MAQVGFFTHAELFEGGVDTSKFAHVITDSLQAVPFGSRMGRLHFLDSNEFTNVENAVPRGHC